MQPPEWGNRLFVTRSPCVTSQRAEHSRPFSGILPNVSTRSTAGAFFPPPNLTDKYTQLNSALFSLNGRTGYVLQPELMRQDNYEPQQEKKSVKYHLDIKVSEARH